MKGLDYLSVSKQGTIAPGEVTGRFIYFDDHSLDMPTTIQISDRTSRLLVLLKEKTGQPSYDKALREVLKEHVKTPRSLAGAYPQLRWSKRDRMKFRGE